MNNEDNAQSGNENNDEKQDQQSPANQLKYNNMAEWLYDYFFVLIRRKIGGVYTWCPMWWKHPEAVSRLDSLWLAWEYLKQEGPLGMSMWWTQHLDAHLPTLMSRDTGPFAACKPDMHRDDLKPLPAVKIDTSIFNE